MRKTKQKSLKDFTTISLCKGNLKMIKGGTDGGSDTTNSIVTDDVIHV